jgi:arsenite-transporting ATPase
VTLPLPSFFTQPGLQVLLFGGKGGVGKTTCATAYALKMAALAPNRSMLLVSTDPAHSLRDSLAGQEPPANLEILELDAAQCLARFHEQNDAMLHDIASAGTFLDDDDVNRFLGLSIPGLDELMAFVGISEWADARRYDCIVVDTAPGGHTLRLLSMPDMIRPWLSMLDALLAKRRYMRKVFSRNVTPDRLDLFVSGWKSCVGRMESLLRDPARCRFVPVTIAEPLALEVTADMLRQLSSRKIPVTDIVVNRLHCQNGCPTCSAAASMEHAEILQLAAVSGTSAALWGIELFADEVRGSAPLAGFWEACWQIERSGGTPHAGGSGPVLPNPRVLHEPAVVDPPAAPATGLRLLLMAGKGGVGKTTLSCATAIRLARDFPQKRILLFSTDPAHSLTACLHVEIGNRLKELLPNLTAIEIDATVEFDKLKARYAADVARFLGAVSGNFDLTFDRVVFEKLMDLAPPGLDEIMALIRIVNLMANRSYDVFVLDCAPTGHLIRLLELPDIVNEWLKSFFNLFLKYDRILRLPGFEEELIGISRNLKKLRAVLLDPVQSALYAVGIPTQMALGETQDLLASCDRMGLSVPLIFLNLMTPPSTCRLCRRLVQRESLQSDEYRRNFPDRHLTLLYRQPELGSMEMLGELGRRLFENVRQEGKVASA